MSIKKICAAIAVLLIAACEPTQNNQEVLNVGVSADYPPFEFYQNGKVVGIDIDIMEAISKELGQKVVIHDMGFDTLIAALQAGRIDLAISSITQTEERIKHVDFSEIYHQTVLALLLPRDSQFTRLEEMPGKVVGTQTGSTMESYLKEHSERLHISIFSVTNNRLLVEELRLGRIDAALLEKNQAQAFVVTNPTLRYYELEKMDDGYAMAFRKGSDLRNKINQALHKLQADGAIDQIKQKWMK